MNKIIYVFAAVFLLLLSIFCFSGSDELKDEWTFKLNQVEPRLLDVPDYGKGLVQFSSDSQYLVAAEEEGLVRLVRLSDKKIIWKKNLGVGALNCAAFSPDQKRLFLGEKSPEGKISCLDLKTKKIIWSYSVGGDLKSQLMKKSYPTINKIMVDSKRRAVYLAAGRFERVKADEYIYFGRLYALNMADGRLLWKFPAQENMDSNCRYFDFKDDRLAFNTTGGTKLSRAMKYPAGSIYCLDLEEQKLLWHKLLSPLKPYFWKASFSFTPNYSADGQYLICFPNDGRLFLLDRDGKEIWQKDVTAPKKVLGGIPLYAPGTFAEFWGSRIIVRTANTYQAGKSGALVPLEHPDANSILCYDLQGKLLWKWRAKGYMPGQSLSGDNLVLPVEKNFRTLDVNVQGVYLLDLKQIKPYLMEEYHLKGGAAAAAVSPDGRYIAAIEVPHVLPDSLIKQGKSQLHLWLRTK
ncbi:MAG: PQQ-binding-like beta-propeller repeat protein [bacterium]